MITKAQSIQFLLASVGLNLGVGATLGILAVPAIKNWYTKLKKPSWTPPNAAFGPVWSALYTAMGVASWMVFKQGGFSAQRKPLGIYALHLAFNFAWQPLFFQAKRLDLAMVDISGLLVMTAATAKAFHTVNPKAGYLMLPTVAWVAYAAALNASLLKKNPQAHRIEVADKEAVDVEADVAASGTADAAKADVAASSTADVAEASPQAST